MIFPPLGSDATLRETKSELKIPQASHEIFKVSGINLKEPMISLLFPLFNERENVIRYNSDLFQIIDGIGKKFGENFEYIFIDDGSCDDTVEEFQEITGDA